MSDDTASVTDAFIQNGFAGLGTVIPTAECDALMTRLRASRNFGPDIFLSQAEFEANPQYKGVNPMDGRNLLQAFKPQSDFILQAPALKAALSGLLGEGYTILNEKFVCGVPDKWLPDWLKPRIIGNPVNNLGAYIRPEYRDITYFYGIDFHQDIIDWKSRLSDFITLYVYIHPVKETDAPLYVLLGSHALGATVFPHDLAKTDRPDHWAYRRPDGESVEVTEKVLTGETGYAAMWHACTLHGTKPVTADSERFSVRYLIARANSGAAGIDKVNESIRGRLSLEETRNDLDASGAAVVKGNIITQM